MIKAENPLVVGGAYIIYTIDYDGNRDEVATLDTDKRWWIKITTDDISQANEVLEYFKLQRVSCNNCLFFAKKMRFYVKKVLAEKLIIGEAKHD